MWATVLSASRWSIPALLSVISLSSLAHAQEVADTAPKTQEIQAVERGFFLEFDFGANWIVNEVGAQKYNLGGLVGLYAGYDILPFLSVMVGASGVSAPSQREQNQAASDLFFLSPQGALQFAIVTTERNFLWIRAGGGFAFALPEQVNGVDFGKNGPMFTGMVGFERYSKLRHFSFGIQAGTTIFLEPALAVGITLMPTLKYTF